jgi:hypothetical protein
LSAMILAAASITNPGYVPTEYQTFLLTVFVMLIHACISSMPTLWIARFNSYGSTINMVCTTLDICFLVDTLTAVPDSTCCRDYNDPRFCDRHCYDPEILPVKSGVVYSERD